MNTTSDKFDYLSLKALTKIEFFKSENAYKLTFKFSDSDYITLSFDMTDDTLSAIDFDKLMRNEYKRIDYEEEQK